ncbi:MAG: threonine/serine dehydratase [Pseudomonadota bacterium]
MLSPSPDDIEAAAKRLRGRIRATPVMQLPAGVFGHPVALKLEHLQVTGSFKVRGAFNNLLTRQATEAGVVAASGGNHGAAVAYAATALGLRSVIFVPRSIAKQEKLERMRLFGGEVILTEGSVADCMDRYELHSETTGALAVHPYDTEWTLAGQGTVAAEMEAAIDGLDTVLIAVGGGGLIGGIMAWFRDRVRVVSVETEGTNTLSRSLEEGPDIEVSASGISAGSLGGPRLGALPYQLAKQHVADAIVLPDAAVFDAGLQLWQKTRLVVEPGAATAMAALTSGAYKPEPDERVGVLLCGGNAETGWFFTP